MADERARAIDLAFAQIEKQFGKGSIMRLGSKEAIVPISVIPTGAIFFAAAFGVGGFPRGRVVEIFGPESSGKTTIALQVIDEAQKQGGMAAFIDAEHALDPIYARKLGVDVDNLLVSQPDYGEQALEITGALIDSGSIDVLVVDSVAALALKFYASVRIDIRRIAAIKDGEAVIGNRTKVKVVKNKLAAPFREAEFDIIYGEGISREGDLMDLGVAHNVVEKSGSWFSYKGERIGQGRENAKQFLKDNVDIRQQLEIDIRKHLGLIKPEPVNGGA